MTRCQLCGLQGVKDKVCACCGHKYNDGIDVSNLIDAVRWEYLLMYDHVNAVREIRRKIQELKAKEKANA